MDATFHALANLLIQAIPTVILFVVLCVYLKYVYFRPVARILQERRRQTEGVRELAQKAFEAADRKASEFEHALQVARAEIHQEHEALRRKWFEEQAQQIAVARAEADKRIEQAKRDIAAEVERAQAQLETQIEALGRQIADTVLTRRAA
jgi:F-type H+-transporting ATPase subunit b